MVPAGTVALPIIKNSGYGGFKTGTGNGLGDGTAPFVPYLAALREAGLDVVFLSLIHISEPTRPY